MTNVNISPTPVQRFVDSNGNALVGGQLFTYQAGTTTKSATYTDATGSVQNTNPIVLNQRGEATIWLPPTQAFKYVLATATDTDPPQSPIWTEDQIQAPASVAVGSMTDEKGSNGQPGFSAANGDFTPGTTTSLTLSQNYGSSSNLWVAFDADEQGADTFSLGGTNNETLTFNAPIPTGISKVYVKGGTALTIGTPGSGTVTDSSVATGSRLYNRIRDIVSITDYGATQTADATSAFQAAALACKNRGGGTVFIPAGTWSVSGTIPSYPNVEFVGAGKFSTFIVPTTINMTVFSLVNTALALAYCAFRDFTIAPSVSGVIGIQLTLCRFTQLENLNFIGCSQNFQIDRGYFHSISHILSEGSSTLAAGAATIGSTVDSDYCFNSNISDYILVNQGSGGPPVGLYMRRANDFELTDIQAYGVTGCDVLIIENDAQAVKVKGLNCAAVQSGVLLRQGTGVAVTPTYTSIADSHIDQPEAFGIQANGTFFTTITDVMVTANASYEGIPAFSLNNDYGSTIDTCVAQGFSASGGALVQLSASNQANIVNNTSSGNYAGVGFANSPTNVSVKNNQFTSPTTPISGSPAGVGNVISGNAGIGSSLLSVPMVASGQSQVNSFGYNCMVYVTGGTISAIAINGTNLALVTGAFKVNVGDSISITYSSAPAWNWVAQQ